MNAPIVANLENIEMFKEILGESFIQETLARQEEIQKNKRDSMRSIDKIKENCNQIAEHLQGIGSSFEKQSISFNKLQNTSSEFAANMFQLSKSSKNLAETFAKTAKTIRNNNLIF